MAVVLAAAVVGAGVALVVTRDTQNAPEPEQLAAGEVRPDRTNTVESSDGMVSVTIPGDSIVEAGSLTIEPVTGPEGRDGWSIDLADALLVGPATIRFNDVGLEAGEPPPLVTSSEQLDGKIKVVRNVRLDGDTVVVTTRHFSNWFLDPWSDLVGTVTDWLVDRMDETASISGDRAPRCTGEQQVRDEGYEPSSDSGRRVYWCLGWENDGPVLKVVNARRYGVLSEHTPGLDIAAREQGGAVDWLAELFTPGPRQPGNHTALLAKGNEVEFTLDPTDPLVGVRLSPDPGGYLLAALGFAVETLDMAFKSAGVTGTAAKIVDALAGTSCLTTFSDLATSDVATPQEAQEFFVEALGLAFSCAQVAGAQIDVGPVNRFLVEPILWVYNGISLAVAGLVAATDLFVDLVASSDGYQIRVEHELPEADPAFVPGGFGELRAGMTAAEALRTGLPETRREGNCNSTLWMRPEYDYVSLAYGWDVDEIYLLFSFDESARTAEGVGVGSTWAALRVAYGDQLNAPEQSAYGQPVVVLETDNGFLSFVFPFGKPLTDGARVSGLLAGVGEPTITFEGEGPC